MLGKFSTNKSCLAECKLSWQSYHRSKVKKKNIMARENEELMSGSLLRSHEWDNKEIC